MKPNILNTVIPIFCLIFISCKKGWIDAKPNQALVVPATLKDLQLLLDNTDLFNDKQPSLLEAGTDNYYVTDQVYDALSQSDKNIYTWASTPDFYANSSTLFEWNRVYLAIFTANTVLEALEKIKPDLTTINQWENIKGSALFQRAYCHYNLSQLYAKQYDKTSASSDPGIILRLESDINIPSTRSTLSVSYEQIITDLLAAKALLTNPLREDKTNPTKAATFAMLARVSLSMENYEKALEFADSCLAINSKILDYNTITDPNSLLAFSSIPVEVLYFTRQVNTPLFPMSNGAASVDTVLYKSYDSSDLRRKVFFTKSNGRLVFKGSYAALPIVLFNGLSTDEIILIKSECLLRVKQTIEPALEIINILYKNRWDNKKTFIPYSANSYEEALQIILTERRKELCFRGIRWSDLRRLNKTPQHSITLKRKINNQEITLLPNDIKYVYPIPNSEILHSGVNQNPR